MVVVLEDYGGFQIRKHEIYKEIDNVRHEVICVHCPEGNIKTYSRLARKCIDEYRTQLSHNFPNEDPLWGTRFHLGSCNEDGNYVVAQSFLVGDNLPEEAKTIDALISIYRIAIDSLFNDGTHETEEL